VTGGTGTGAAASGEAGKGTISGPQSIAGEGGGPPGPRAAAAPGGGSGVGAEYGSYLTALRQRIQQSVRYPATARRRGLAGTVSVEILILANGTISKVTLLESSSHQVLDEAALDTIRALPRMPLPSSLPARPLRVRVPVVFQMR
jgi:TonB family protein